MKTFKLVFLNSTVQIIGKLISVAASFLVIAIITHSLGLTGYGEYTIFVTYTALFYMVADFGFNAIALREAGNDEEEIRKNFRSLLGLRIVYGSVLVLLAVAILNFFPYSPAIKIATIINCLTILLIAIINSANLIFQFRLRYDLSVLALAVGDILTVSAIYLLSQTGINIIGIAFVNVLTLLASVVLSLSFVKFLIGRVQPRFNISEWKQLFNATLPVGLTLIFNLVYFRADTLILSVTNSAVDVGIYGLAYKFFESALVAPTFIMNSLYPILIRSFKSDPDDFRRNVRVATWVLLGLSVVGAVVAIVIAPYIFKLFNASSSILPFQILIASAPIFFLSSLYMWLMLILGKQTQMAVVYLSGMIINIALNLLFIPIFSYNAAAIITGVSEGFILVLTYYLSREWQQHAHRD